MTQDDTTVLVVGGGPAGLMTAMLLARYGVPTLVIERRACTSIHPRARGLDVRTMEILRAQGLEAAVLAAGAPLARNKWMLFVETLAGREVRRVPDDDLMMIGDALARYTPCTWTQCAQDELEPLLLDAALAAGAQIRFGSELVAMTHDESGVVCTLRARASGDTATVRARYVVAADGGRSTVREQLGIPFEHHGTFGHFVNIYFRADLADLVRDRWFGICFVENEAVEGLFLSVNNTDRWLFNVEYDPATTALESFTPERCEMLIRAAVGLPHLDLTLLSVLPWEAASRLAPQMQHDRVFLVGDAAHTMPPAGAHGLNSAVQDAHNLAWKLAAVVYGAAGAGLLESYPAERLPVARALVQRAAQAFNPDAPDAPNSDWQPTGQDDAPSEPDWGADAPNAEQQLADVIGQRYGSTAIVVEAGEHSTSEVLNLHGEPGTRAPHVWLWRGIERISTLDVFNGPFVLLAGSRGRPWRDALVALPALAGVGAVGFVVGTAGDLRDTNGEWQRAYGVNADGAVLVRPDGYIAWRSVGAAAEPRRVLGDVFASVLGKRA